MAKDSALLENSTYLTSKFYFPELFQQVSVQANLQEGESNFVGSGKDKLE